MIIPNHLRFCRPAWALLAALIINLSSCDDDNLGGWNEGESDIFEGKIKELVRRPKDLREILSPSKFLHPINQ